MPTAVAFRAQLERDAKAARAAGDPRTLGNLMADIAMARVLNPTITAAAPATTESGTTESGTTETSATETGTTAGTATIGTTGTWPTADPAGVSPHTPDGAAFTGPVAIQLLITDRTLSGGDEPAHFANGEPYPAPLARDLAVAPGMNAAARTIRRLFTDPAGRVVTAETTSRVFTPAMREVVTLRDGTCTTPWCNAPVADIDHHHPSSRGGPTSLTNARGLCRWCNVTKADQPPDPPPSTHAAPAPPTSPLERRLRRRIHRQARLNRRRAGRIEVALTGHTAGVVRASAGWSVGARWSS